MSDTFSGVPGVIIGRYLGPERPDGRDRRRIDLIQAGMSIGLTWEAAHELVDTLAAVLDGTATPDE